MPIALQSCILRDYNQTITQKLCTKILQKGPMPKHVAIIMDGNRRFAKLKQLGSPTEGHKKGEEKLLEVVKMFLDLGIEETTLYSFSEDNFKRSPAEVRGIMDLTINRMKKICDGSDELRERGIRWDVVGNWNKIPSLELKCLFAKTCLVSKDHQKLTLHLAFSYSAHQEISEGISYLVDGLLNNLLKKEDLNELLLQDAFSLHSSYPVDILIRTAGDKRLSDFVLWQASGAYLEFIDVTWPEFGYGDLLGTILHFQCQKIDRAFNYYFPTSLPVENKDKNMTNHSFIQGLRQRKWAFLKNLIRQYSWDS